MYSLQRSSDLDALLEDIGDRSIVMLGEASHGTHEFYTWRTAITKRLILEKGFQFLGVEGDWPDCIAINCWVKGSDRYGTTIEEVLKHFNRWPTWMWANWEVAALAEWMREHNKHLPEGKKVGFYGLDVYSLWDSLREIMNYLQAEDPEAAVAVQNAMQCFAPYEEQEHLYARFSLNEHSCRDKVLQLLRSVRRSPVFADNDSEAAFSAEQNALIAVNAEKYYSVMMGFDNESWNVRDRHMMETLSRLIHFHGRGSKAIVWEHNTHIGDARATDMKRAGMVNIGQLAREEYGISSVYLAGFGTYEGRVMAGEAWGAPMQEMEVPPAREGSIEYALHSQFKRDGYLLFNTAELMEIYSQHLPHRAIGVVYNPKREKLGNYVPSIMAERYDAFIFIDESQAVHPVGGAGDPQKLPDLYPFGV